ncbi:hypothetical protein [Moraxella lacunata]|uniref:hypothetical protein n=1 Tax=Moraxella lacunata TaxID=477 RepID=UPI003EE28F34
MKHTHGLSLYGQCLYAYALFVLLDIDPSDLFNLSDLLKPSKKLKHWVQYALKK